MQHINLIKLDHLSQHADAFICSNYDMLRILLLLSLIIFVIFRDGKCFQPDKMKHIITHKYEFIDKILEKLLAVGKSFM